MSTHSSDVELTPEGEAVELLNSKADPHFSLSDLKPYGLNVEQLLLLIDPKNIHVLQAIGGLPRLSSVLNTNPDKGLVEEQLTGPELESREKIYGRNKLPEQKQRSLLKIIWLTLDDKILIILIIAALISLALGLYETFGQPPEYDPEGNKLPKVDWVEGVAILVAVVIVTLVGSINDWNKERQFAKLNRKKDKRMIEVVRGGMQQQVDIEEILVGDVVCVQPGDVIATDGIVLESNDVQCDESSITGESDTMKKLDATSALAKLESGAPDRKCDCFMISGAKVIQGSGKYLVTGVGTNSMWGRTFASLHQGTEVTPLQEKLNRIADGIAKFGIWSAIILFTVLLIKFLVEISGDNHLSHLNGSQKGNMFMDIFIVSITIIVVAVPEGLPLAVTLALAFATTRMVKDNCLVRVLKSCETMGGATSICSDKTGTLTQNKMSVVKSHIADLELDPSTNGSESRAPDGTDGTHGNDSAHGTDYRDEDETHVNGDLQFGRKFANTEFETLVRDVTCVNGTVYEDHDNPTNLVGSKTEIALVNFARAEFGVKVGGLKDYVISRNVVHVLPFDSARKYMATVIKLDDNNSESKYRILLKGAAEMLLPKMDKVLKNSDLETEDVNESIISDINNKIGSYADSALRCIAVAYVDIKPSSEPDFKDKKLQWLENQKFVFVGLFGIQDPLRPGVRHAVEQCQRAGVTVRMVTGDNLRTAKAISKNAGILHSDEVDNDGDDDNDSDDVLVLEGPEFRKISDEELVKLAPKIRVLARSSPQDKRRLVEFLKLNDETVAVTGDGTNDAPALRLADVGFSMGIAGTEVAKEASDIIIMDDNFATIVNAIKWGRTVNDAVKKFLQFQLTVNVTAVTLTFVTAIASEDNESALNAVELLWVNLIMDTLAALALATDPPTDEVLDRMPDNRKKSLITPTMWKMIFGQSLYQLIVTFVLNFAGKSIFFGKDHELTAHEQIQIQTLVFNTFVWMQFFNMFVNRRLDNHQNIFKGVFRNPYFIGIMCIIGGFQVLIMFVGGAAFNIVRNTGAMWGTALICGLCSILMGFLTRLVPDSIVMILFPKKLWNIIMFILDSVENGAAWLFSPVSKLCGYLYRLITGKTQQRDETRSMQTVDRYGNVKTHGNPVEDFTWTPGIQKSIAQLSFIQKVRGGRSKQLKFFERMDLARRRSSSVYSVSSSASDSSALVGFMAPMVVGGAVGGWGQLPKSHQ